MYACIKKITKINLLNFSWTLRGGDCTLDPISRDSSPSSSCCYWQYVMFILLVFDLVLMPSVILRNWKLCCNHELLVLMFKLMVADLSLYQLWSPLSRQDLLYFNFNFTYYTNFVILSNNFGYFTISCPQGPWLNCIIGRVLHRIVR